MLSVIKETGLPVKNFKGMYEISSHGKVSNYRIIMKPYIINSGYLSIKFTKNKIRTSHLIHRLVAEAFIPNTENKREVNHIDGNKLNNKVTNLEWVTSAENKQHAIATGLKVYNLPTLGIKKGKGSKYFNVSYVKGRNKWVGCVRHNKKTYFQKRFNTEIEAAKHVNWILDELKLFDRPRNVL